MRPRLTRRLDGFGTSVFAEMTALARRHSAVNLGQGYPDFDGPEFVKRAAGEAIAAGHNQYAPMPGLPALQEAVARHQQRFYGLSYDPATEITVHAGATEALCATLAALLDPGDEAIVFEPFYDAYLPGIALAQATARVVPLEAPLFRLDAAALEAAVSPRTRVLVLNSPMNPCGRVFSRPELEAIAGLCRRHDVVVVTDEVYEHILFDDPHVPIATLPGMRERTVTISSAGKTFSLTGWKIGWTCARARADGRRPGRPPVRHVRGRDAVPARGRPRARRVRLVLRRAAAGLSRPPRPALRRPRRGRLRRAAAGRDVLRARRHPAPRLRRRRGLLPAPRRETVGVAAIPNSAFSAGGRVRHLVRFAFCKDDATLAEGLRRLERLRVPLAAWTSSSSLGVEIGGRRHARVDPTRSRFSTGRSGPGAASPS